MREPQGKARSSRPGLTVDWFSHLTRRYQQPPEPSRIVFRSLFSAPLGSGPCFASSPAGPFPIHAKYPGLVFAAVVSAVVAHRLSPPSERCFRGVQQISLPTDADSKARSVIPRKGRAI